LIDQWSLYSLPCRTVD